MCILELNEVYKARERVRLWVRETPIEHSHFLSELCGGEVRLKMESLQLTGSFKIRGALNKILQFSEESRGRGVVTASSGNHGQGVGYAAGMLGIYATIVVPRNTPEAKLDAIRRYGAELVVHGDEYMDAERLARRIEREEGKTFVSAYNDLEVIAGQGTTGLEMAEYEPYLDVVLVPVGGGGLISGVGSVFKRVLPEAEVLGVQSVASPVMYESIRRGRIVEMELGASVAEGLHGGIEEGSITFDLCRNIVDDFILVKEETIIKAIRLMLAHQRRIVEGAGAVGVAAILEDPDRFRNRKTGIVISGGNLDPNLLRKAVCGG